jgi:uncharacterized hydrophobic protein (TIGR00271 family)
MGARKNRLSHYLNDSWKTLVSDYREFKEGPQPLEEILTSFRRSSLPVFGYYFMLAVSTLITTFGLIGNSSATIIGAMIISPLMNPIISLAFGITARNRQLIDRGCLMLITGIPLIILVAYLASNIIGIRAIGSEVISRSHPTYLDLGVALGAGTAAAFAYSRQSISSALPGVAIAVALLPPLCVVGIGMNAGTLGEFMAANAGIDEYMSLGALNLFITNLWGIVFAGVLVFTFQKYGRWKQAFIGLAISFAMLLMVMVPLGEGFYKMYIRELFYKELLRYRTDEKKFSELEIHNIDIRFLRNKYRVQLALFGNIENISDVNLESSQEKINKISKRLSAKLKHPVLIEMNIIPMYHIRSEGIPPTAENPA